ncbi:MAG TPA: class I SAM-dependent methyltransferase [Blastocatellia bacterium]|nr:class I SAM-dependent methyltransferase [Blastocatellia bacterium]
MKPDPPTKDVLREWRDSAPYWAKHADAVHSMFAPISAALLEAAEIARGQTVLDVAGGSGEPSITLAEEVGVSGLVICTDAVAEMLDTAKHRARHRRLTNIEFTQCMGGSLPFAGSQFDAVICRLGIMLFTDTESAAREMLRVAKPGGAAACAVWHTRESNPFFQVVADVVSRYVDSQPEDPDAPGAFRYAEPGKLARVFGECGATEVAERLLDFKLEAQLSPKQFWDLRLELSDTLRTKVAPLSRSELETIAREIEKAGQPFFAGGRMEFPAQVLIVRARKGEQ